MQPVVRTVWKLSKQAPPEREIRHILLCPPHMMREDPEDRIFTQRITWPKDPKPKYLVAAVKGGDSDFTRYLVLTLTPVYLRTILARTITAMKAQALQPSTDMSVIEFLDHGFYDENRTRNDVPSIEFMEFEDGCIDDIRAYEDTLFPIQQWDPAYMILDQLPDEIEPLDDEDEEYMGEADWRTIEGSSSAQMRVSLPWGTLRWELVLISGKLLSSPEINPVCLWRTTGSSQPFY